VSDYPTNATTPANIAALRLLVDDATPGPWRAHKSQVLFGEREEWVEMPTRCDAAYITAIPPEVMRVILDRLTAVEAEREALLARVAELEAARRLCDECSDDDEEHGLDLVGDWHCGSCGAVI